MTKVQLGGTSEGHPAYLPFHQRICHTYAISDKHLTDLFSKIPEASEGKLSPVLCSLYWYKHFPHNSLKYFLLQWRGMWLEARCGMWFRLQYQMVVAQVFFVPPQWKVCSRLVCAYICAWIMQQSFKTTVSNNTRSIKVVFFQNNTIKTRILCCYATEK